MNSENPKTIILTIDVEDWFQVENLRSQFPPATWKHQQLRVEQNTHNILNLLDTIPLESSPAVPISPKKPSATFFVLGASIIGISHTFTIPSAALLESTESNAARFIFWGILR